MGKVVMKKVPFGGSAGSAENIKYDETTNVKEAIDGVKSDVSAVSESLVGVNGKKIEFGTITIANGSSDITFDEFGSNPTVVAIARASGTPAFATCVVQSTTQARLYVWNAKTGELLNSSMTIEWVAVGDNK